MEPFFSSVEATNQQQQRLVDHSGGSVQAISSFDFDGANAKIRVAIPTMDELYELFSHHGMIDRIIWFFREGLCKVLIEFHSSASSARAKAEFDGKEMRSTLTGHSFGKMRIGFAQYPKLVVDEHKLSKGEGRDYECERELGMIGNLQQTDLTSNDYRRAPAQQTIVHEADQSSNPVLRVSCLTKAVRCEHLKSLFSLYGQVKKIKFCYHQPDAALVEFCTPVHAMLALKHLQHSLMFGRRIEVEYSRHESVQLMQSDNGMTAQSREYASDQSMLDIQQLEGHLGEDLTTPSNLLCFHGCTSPSLHIFQILSSQLPTPPIRHFETSSQNKRGEMLIFLQFSCVAAAIDAVAQFNGVAILSGNYVCQITFATMQQQPQSQQNHPPAVHSGCFASTSIQQPTPMNGLLRSNVQILESYPPAQA